MSKNNKLNTNDIEELKHENISNYWNYKIKFCKT